MFYLVPCASFQHGVTKQISIFLTSRLSSSLFFSGYNLETTSGANQDPVLRLPLLEAELATLMEDPSNEQKNEQQETLREAIANAKTAAEFGVRKTQLEFYDAFSRGNIELMERIWSRQSHVRCVHPGMTSLEGRDEVMASWREIFQFVGFVEGVVSEIEPTRSHVEVHGLIAMCSCVEKTKGGGNFETFNVYRREEGAWKMTLHMASSTIMSV